MNCLGNNSLAVSQTRGMETVGDKIRFSLGRVFKGSWCQAKKVFQLYYINKRVDFGGGGKCGREEEYHKQIFYFKTILSEVWRLNWS